MIYTASGEAFVRGMGFITALRPVEAPRSEDCVSYAFIHIDDTSIDTNEKETD